MDANVVIEILLAVCGFAVSWWVNNLWKMVQSQQLQITSLALKLAEEYVAKDDWDKGMERLFDKIDHVQAAVNNHIDALQREVNHISRNLGQAKVLQDYNNSNHRNDS